MTEAVLAVDVDNKVSKSGSSEHNVFFEDGDSCIKVILRELLIEVEASINEVLGDLEALVSPSLVLAAFDLIIRIIDVVFAGEVGGNAGEMVPVAVTKRKVGVTCIFVQDRVPNSVEISCAIFVGNPLVIATAVTGGVVVIDLSNGVERLVSVTDVVDDQTEGERYLIDLIAEPILDLLIVGVVRGDASGVTLYNQDTGCQSFNEIDLTVCEVIIADITTLVKVGLIDEVPVRLCLVAETLDVVGVVSALGEWMVVLLGGDVGVVLLQVSEIRVGFGQGTLTSRGRLKNGFSSAGDYYNKRQLLDWVTALDVVTYQSGDLGPRRRWHWQRERQWRKLTSFH